MSKFDKELNSVLAYELRKELGTDKRMRVDAKEFVRLFQDRYERKFSDVLPISRSVATQYMRRAFLWCGEDTERLKSIILWMVDEWETISVTLGLAGRPSIGLFGSAVMFQRVRDLKDAPTTTVSIKARAARDASPSEGW